MAVWLVGWLTVWLVGWLFGWLVGLLTVWLAGWLAVWLTGWLTGWLTDWLTGWLTGWLTVWLAGWLTVWLCLASAGLFGVRLRWRRRSVSSPPGSKEVFTGEPSCQSTREYTVTVHQRIYSDRAVLYSDLLAVLHIYTEMLLSGMCSVLGLGDRLCARNSSQQGNRLQRFET